MDQNDVTELHRLCGMLRTVDDSLDADSTLREAVAKGALALSIAFAHGLRSKIEDMTLGLDKPLDESQRDHLRSLGIEP